MLQVPFFFTFRDKNVQAKVDQFEFCTDYDYFVIHREGEISSVKVPVFSAFLDCLPTHWESQAVPKDSAFQCDAYWCRLHFRSLLSLTLAPLAPFLP